MIQDQPFPNLYRLRYVTAAALADYPTVFLAAWYLETEYIDLALNDAPPDWQAIVQAWDGLVADNR